MIYELLEKKIVRGTIDKNDILTKLDVFLLHNRITKEEYDTLVILVNKRTDSE